MLARKLLLLLLLRLLLAWSGSCTLSPLALAKTFSISVKLTTPDRCPLMFWPGKAAAGTAFEGAVGVCGRPCVIVVGLGAIAGVEGMDDAGEGLSGESTIHNRCERVATSLATVCARVEVGVM